LALTPSRPSPARKSLALSLAALGIVFGDIGTSPLYAFKACFSPEYGLAPTRESVFGLLSLISWALTITVSVKYVGVIMRADNDGEGGILALLALVTHREKTPAPASAPGRQARYLAALGVFGAALLYGDGAITPAISVLSAVEGLTVAATRLGPLVVPLAVALLLALFAFQRRGTASLGRVFGPLMALWFVTIGILGASEVVRAPEILRALDPLFAIRFLGAHGLAGFLVLGAVVLAVTGAEALYADMGHFGKRPIRMAWFVLVFPALVLNYFGQGALLLRDARAAANPFYNMAPTLLLYPLVGLATVATVIASQALISGAFSLTQQAIHLGYSPRLRVLHTSEAHAGQIYIPAVNAALAVLSLSLVVGFRSSNALGAAYGIAVTGTMAVTTLLFYVLARQHWGWSRVAAAAVAGGFLIVDAVFFGANVVKIARGGWVPVAIAVCVFVLMSTWHRGRALLVALRGADSFPLEHLFRSIAEHSPTRIPGRAIYLSAHRGGVPRVLLHHLKDEQVLHESVVLLNVEFTHTPLVADEDRVRVESLAHGFVQATVRFGFAETPTVTTALAAMNPPLLPVHGRVTYYLAHERVLAGPNPTMAAWRKRLFIFLVRNAHPATDFFGIPPNATIELGSQLEI
jgi:KUP system potassium uptake protein